MNDMTWLQYRAYGCVISFNADGIIIETPWHDKFKIVFDFGNRSCPFIITLIEKG